MPADTVLSEGGGGPGRRPPVCLRYENIGGGWIKGVEQSASGGGRVSKWSGYGSRAGDLMAMVLSETLAEERLGEAVVVGCLRRSCRPDEGGVVNATREGSQRQDEASRLPRSESGDARGGEV